MQIESDYPCAIYSGLTKFDIPFQLQNYISTAEYEEIIFHTVKRPKRAFLGREESI